MIFSLTGPGLFRLSLALLVFLNHTSRVDLGFSAVLIFFVLSGYWIFSMWTTRYSKARKPYATFLVSRMWRLLPAFLLCSAIAWSLAILNDDVPPLRNWLYQLVPNLIIIGYSLDWQPNVPAWSLDIEVQFYLIAPLLIGLMARHRRTVVAASFVCSIVAISLGTKWFVAYYLVFFAVGMAAASAQWRPSPRLAWGALGFTFMIITIWMTSSYHHTLVDTDKYLMPRGYNEAADAVFAVTMIPWAVYTASQRGTKLDQAMGDLSYLVYLFHEPLYRALNFETASHIDRVLMKSGVLIIIFTVSFVVWLSVDRPSNRLRSQWVTSRLRPASQHLGSQITGLSGERLDTI
jgi:peptidoglycan/LPS O-acetylase OafA/YrhL